MRRTIALFFIALATDVFAQEQVVHGKITYIVGDVLYISIGKDSGVRDSSLLFVVPKLDTIAMLKVFATSSKSSAARIVRTNRVLKIEDPIIASVQKEESIVAKKDTVARIESAVMPRVQPAMTLAESSAAKSRSIPAVALQGRASVQYFGNIQSVASQTISQPGIVLDLRGRVNNSHIGFEMYGNFRSISYGGQSPVVNRTRIYRMSVDYDDSVDRLSLGRILPPFSASVGYTDGALFTRKIGEMVVGAAAGFEPSFDQRTFSADRKKIAFFAGYASPATFHSAVSIAYSRTYYLSQLDREVVSSTLSVFPVNDFFLTAQGDVDLRSKSSQDFVLSPKLTTFFANANYRVNALLSVGAGMSAWRPTYSFSSVSAIPDSLIDQNVRTSPNLNVSLYFPGGVSLYNNYSPRSSDEGFGHEYLNYTSFGAYNLLNAGIAARMTMNVNATSFTTTRGYGASVQKSLNNMLDVTVRYQVFTYNMAGLGESSNNQSAAMDVLYIITRNLSVYGSVERIGNLSDRGYSVLAEIDWRF
ncbi:MAG: hypothetical protein ABSF91_05780 [Bacteroidota bacterium]|jgi:hypothetical protein